MEQIYTPEEAAKALKVTPNTVRKYCSNGTIKAAKLGRVYRITETDLRAFMEKQSRPGRK